MYVLDKIKTMMAERNWSAYQLAKEADIPVTTIYSMFDKNNCPTVPTLEKICNAFGTSLSEFFKDEQVSSALRQEKALLLEKWSQLNDEQKAILMKLIEQL